MNDKQFETIISQLEIITKLIALSITTDGNQKDQIELFGKIGLKPKNIAEILNTTPNTVSVTLSKMKSKK